MNARLALVVAGSDPSGGAGLELDLKVLALHGVHGAAVATCLTRQSARRLEAVGALPVAAALARLDLVVATAPIGAVKVGLLPNSAWIEALAERFGAGRWPLRVVDPVVGPTRGERILGGPALARMRRRLLPCVDLLTPNAPEAAALLGVPPAEVARDPDRAARQLLELGPRSVLLKGGHLSSPRARVVVDYLRGEAGEVDLPQPRRRGPSPRGTGCALASALVARIVGGATLVDAVRAAQRWVAAARAAAVRFDRRGRPYLGLVPAAPDV